MKVHTLKQTSFPFIALCALLGVSTAHAKADLPLPRFVSIKSPESNLRTGPGLRYPVRLVITRPGVPVEVIAEFENWRKIRDIEGDEGWVHRSMVSGERRVTILHGTQTLYDEPEPDAQPVAFVEEGVNAVLKECDENWCEVNADGNTGWIMRKLVWGVYVGEQKIEEE